MSANLNSLGPVQNIQPPVNDKLSSNKKVEGPGFEDALSKLNPLPNSNNVNRANQLKFSNHAVERMTSRGIYLQPQQLKRLEDAVSKAAAKGAKETLVLIDDAAMIVSVKNRTVVTAMDKTSLKENVFTNIDSTVVL